MIKSGKKQQFSDVWTTQTQLGKLFRLSAREIGQKLNELGLRTYSVIHRKHIPTQYAISAGFCTSALLKHGIPFYMWHKDKISQLFQEKMYLMALSDDDIEHRETALYLIDVEKETDEDYDKMYYLFFDTISPEDLPSIIAWSLIEACKSNDPVYQRLVGGIAPEDFAVINRELERLASPIRLQAKTVLSVVEEIDSLS